MLALRDAYIDQVLRVLLNQVGASSGHFWLYDPLRGTGHLVAKVGEAPESTGETDEGLRIPISLGTEYLGSFNLYGMPVTTSLSAETSQAQVLAQQVIPLIHLTRQAAQDQLVAVLEERYRLASEIHDALAQHLAGILLQLGVARRIAEQQPEEAWRLVAQASDLARMGVEEARRSIWALQPSAIEYSDLATSLPQVVTQMTADTAIEAEVSLYGEPHLLPAVVGMNLLRICQEAINNALHHAQAHHLFVELTFGVAEVRLWVQDDGQGFDPQTQGDGGGFGLMGMHQRAARIGGLLTIRSQPGHGTEIAVTVPVALESESEIKGA